MEGVVRAIHVAPAEGAGVEPRERVEAGAGRGLRGDRYFDGERSPGDAGGREPGTRRLPR